MRFWKKEKKKVQRTPLNGFERGTEKKKKLKRRNDAHRALRKTHCQIFYKRHSSSAVEKKKAKRGFVPRRGEHGTVESSSTLSLLQWK